MTEIACVFPFSCHPVWVFLLGAVAVSVIFTAGFAGLALALAEARVNRPSKPENEDE